MIFPFFWGKEDEDEVQNMLMFFVECRVMIVSYVKRRVLLVSSFIVLGE